MSSRTFFNIKIKDISSNENKKEQLIIPIKVRWHTTIEEVKELILSHSSSKFSPSASPVSSSSSSSSSTSSNSSNIYVNNIHVFSQTSRRPLTNKTSLCDLNVGEGSILYMWNGNAPKQSTRIAVRGDTAAFDAECLDLIATIRVGLELGIQPKALKDESTGGVYFLKDSKGTNAGVFKPSDEEQGMCNNPYSGRPENVCQRRDFTPGMGFCRENAAYLMDWKGVAGVPSTTEVIINSPAFNHRSGGIRAPKVGSLQQFVHSDGIFEDYGVGLFSDFEVQKIALLDMRILNNDRHGGNLLVRRYLSRRGMSRSNSYDDEPSAASAMSSLSFRRRNMRRSSSISSYGSVSEKDEEDEEEATTMDLDNLSDGEYGQHNSGFDYELIPIDHGYCFPPKLHINVDNWVWFNYPQVKRPVCPELITYMRSIDIDKLLDNLGEQCRGRIEEDSFFLLRVMHNMIVDGLNSGLTLYQIAECIIRKELSCFDEDKETSLVEDIITYADYNANRALSINSAANVWHLENGGVAVGNNQILSSSTNSSSKVQNKNSDFFSSTMPLPTSSGFAGLYNSKKKIAGKEIRKLHSLDDSILVSPSSSSSLSSTFSSFPLSYHLRSSRPSFSIDDSKPSINNLESNTSQKSQNLKLVNKQAHGFENAPSASNLVLSDIGCTDESISDDYFSSSSSNYNSPSSGVESPMKALLATRIGDLKCAIIAKKHDDGRLQDVVDTEEHEILKLLHPGVGGVTRKSNKSSDNSSSDDYIIGEADDEVEDDYEGEVGEKDESLNSQERNAANLALFNGISGSENRENVHTNSLKSVVGQAGGLGLGLVRIASFSAFSSTKLYSPSVAKKKPQAIEAANACQSEYLRLRNKFVDGAWNSLVKKKVRTVEVLEGQP